MPLWPPTIFVRTRRGSGARTCGATCVWWTPCARWPSSSGVTPAQLALAWALHRGDDIVPLVGARTRERLAEALAALEIRLDADDMARLEAAVPAAAVAGARYDAQRHAHARQRDPRPAHEGGWTSRPRPANAS